MSGIPLLVLDVSLWYYTRGVRDLFALWLNFVWFVNHFFSLPLLMRTFFNPWKRMTDGYRLGGFEEIAGTFVLNITSRIFGACIRLFLIIGGVCALILMTVILFFVVVGWLCLPIFISAAIIYGVALTLS